MPTQLLGADKLHGFPGTFSDVSNTSLAPAQLPEEDVKVVFGSRSAARLVCPVQLEKIISFSSLQRRALRTSCWHSTAPPGPSTQAPLRGGPGAQFGGAPRLNPSFEARVPSSKLERGPGQYEGVGPRHGGSMTPGSRTQLGGLAWRTGVIAVPYVASINQTGATGAAPLPCTAHRRPDACLQLNIAFPSTGCQKKLEIEDDAKL